MTKEKYKEYIQNSYDTLLERVRGWHDLASILKILDEYINYSIDLCHDIYADDDIDYQSYIELNEMISHKLREVCWIVRRG